MEFDKHDLRFKILYFALFISSITVNIIIFIDMIAPEWPRAIHKLARFSLDTIVIPMGIGQSIYSTSTLVIALFCVHAPAEEGSWFLSLYFGCFLLASWSTFEMCGVSRLCFHGVCHLTSLLSWRVSPCRFVFMAFVALKLS